MSEEASLSADGQAPVLSMWCVAFLDLLGYRELLQSFDVFPFPELGPEHDKFQKAFARAVFFRRRLDGAFRTILDSTNRMPNSQLSSFPEHQRRLAETWTRTRVVQTTGADHVAIGCSLAEEKDHFPILGVYTVLSACAHGMLVQLMAGADEQADTLPLRGGVDVAMGGIDPGSSYLYSAALANAYDLERRAVYPRTLVSPRLREYLLSVSVNVDANLTAKYARAIAIRATDLITTDTDGMAIIDFFGEASVQMVEDPRQMGAAAWRYANASAERFSREGNTHVAKKYEWLISYMHPRLGLWGVSG